MRKERFERVNIRASRNNWRKLDIRIWEKVEPFFSFSNVTENYKTPRPQYLISLRRTHPSRCLLRHAAILVAPFGLRSSCSPAEFHK